MSTFLSEIFNFTFLNFRTKLKYELGTKKECQKSSEKVERKREKVTPEVTPFFFFFGKKNFKHLHK
jgi:hypothetical protein